LNCPLTCEPASITAHDDGAELKNGVNGGVDGSKPNSEVRLLVGLFKIFNKAVVTSVGAAPPEGVASVNSVPQFDPSPATPPLVFTHDDTMSASVLISVLGTVSPAGTEVPGDVPVAVFANCEASVNAAVSPDASDVPDPMQVGAVVQVAEVIYGKSAATAATVVTSFKLMAVVGLSELHGPSAAIRSIAVLLVPLARPGLPPVASR
jgi:hypothetical protein